MNTRLAVALGLCVLLKVSAFATSVPEDAAVQELIALEEQWTHAEGTHDADTLRTILDERFIVVSDRGVRSRDDFIASVTKGDLDPTQTQTLSDRKFLVHGDTAVVSEIDTVRGTRDGKPVEFSFRCTTTYVRRDGKWRAIAEVFNKVPSPK